MPVQISRKLHDRDEKLSPTVRDIAWKVRLRLCSPIGDLLRPGRQRARDQPFLRSAPAPSSFHARPCASSVTREPRQYVINSGTGETRDMVPDYARQSGRDRAPAFIFERPRDQRDKQGMLPSLVSLTKANSTSSAPYLKLAG